MALKLWNPFYEMFNESFTESSTYKPLTDVVESDNDYQITFDVPGITKEDVSIDITGDTLEISTENGTEKLDDWKIQHKERFRTKYYRKLVFPGILDAKKASTLLKDGVLTVTIPKIPELQKVKLTIN